MKKSVVLRPMPFLLNLFLTLGGGALVGLATRRNPACEALCRPPFSPPGWVFGLVWNILYFLMAVSVALIISRAGWDNTATKLFYGQLAVNLFWPLLFFSFGQLTFSFVWLLLLIVLTAAMLRAFFKISPTAGVLQLPYLLWLLFAAYLNLGFAVLN